MGFLIEKQEYNMELGDLVNFPWDFLALLL